MAYNKAKAERKWLKWKNSEEEKLRSLGVSQQDIDMLRQFDRAVFNSDRRYYQRLYDAGTYLADTEAAPQREEVSTVQRLLDSIENEELYQTLLAVDERTLLIVVLKMQGYSTNEIAAHLQLSCKAVYRRMDRLKEKLKKFSE